MNRTLDSSLDEMKINFICPQCKSSIEIDQFEKSTKSISCINGHVFKSKNNILRFVSCQGNYTDAFGYQWNKYRQTQLDSYTKCSISEDRLKRYFGEELFYSLLIRQEPYYLLEAGCGAGRFTEILRVFKAARIISFDLSNAVEACESNFPQSRTHKIYQCDINNLPFSPEQFDIVLCLGVIQHTKSSSGTITKLYEQIKPGGYFIFDHYTPSVSYFTKISSLFLRPILKRLPSKSAHAITTILTKMFFPLHRLTKKSRILQFLLSRVSPLLTYFHSYPNLNDQLQFELALLDTHDSLTDYYKHLLTKKGARKILTNLGAVELKIVHAGNGIEVICRKPMI